MTRIFLKFGKFFAALVILFAVAFVLPIGFGRPESPPPLSAIDGVVSGRTAASELPPYSEFVARDDVSLAYRAYAGRPGKGVAVVLHGSSGTSAVVHNLAVHLADVGISTYSLDLRGHGRSGKLGDVSYVGQYQNDLADFARYLRSRHPGERLVLVGHSSGGSVVLRTASERAAAHWDGFLALSPFIASGRPFSRPNEGGWTNVSVPRIIAISIANGLGIDAFDDLSVMAMAVPEGAGADRARTYSFRLLSSLNLPRDWFAALAGIRKPTFVLIGAADELFYASAYAVEFEKANKGIDVETLPRIGHMSMLFETSALDRAVAVTQTLLAVCFRAEKKNMAAAAKPLGYECD